MENEDTKAVDDNSKFFKLSPDSISKFNKEENLIKIMDEDICEITETIREKNSKINYRYSALNSLKDSYKERRNREASNEKLKIELYMALDELNAMINTANGEWFGEKLDKRSLNYLKLHGSKSLAKEKQILRNKKIQQKDIASFKSPSHLFDSSFASILTMFTREEEKMFCWSVENLELIRRKYSYYMSDEQRLFIEIEQLRIQQLERTSTNDSMKGNIPKYESLKKSIEAKIKGICDYSLRERKECLECGIKVRQNRKEFEALNKEINSLVGKLRMRHDKRDETYQRICKLYHEEEVGMFMLEWNNYKPLRNFEKHLLLSFEEQQRCRDATSRTIKSNHAVEI